MIVRNRNVHLPIPIELQEYVIVDIETTGFSPKYNQITILGLILKKQPSSKAEIIQYMTEQPSDEAELLHSLSRHIAPSSTIISYNGTRFDLPFIEKRIKANNSNELLYGDHIDLYEFLKSNQRLTGINAVGQKEFEIRNGIKRPFYMDGKEAVDYYKKYITTRDKFLSDRLLDYNELDIVNLGKLMQSYFELRERKTVELILNTVKCIIEIDSVDSKKDLFTIKTKTKGNPFDIEVDYQNENYRIKWHKDQLAIIIETITGKVSADQVATCFYTGSMSDKLRDKSEFRLSTDYLVIEYNKVYRLENLKDLVIAIMTNFMKKIEINK